jgi:hypothetical protein
MDIHTIRGTNNIFSPLDTILENRGIKDTERFLKPSKEDVIHHSKLVNMDRAVKMFDRHKGSTSEFAIVVDSDAD